MLSFLYHLSHFMELVNILWRSFVGMLQHLQNVVEPIVGHPFVQTHRSSILVVYRLGRPTLTSRKSFECCHVVPKANPPQHLSHANLFSLNVFACVTKKNRLWPNKWEKPLEQTQQSHHLQVHIHSNCMVELASVSHSSSAETVLLPLLVVTQREVCCGSALVGEHGSRRR
jgi:hypothetical protein